MALFEDIVGRRRSSVVFVTGEDGDVALREAAVPAHAHVLARLRLARLPVVVRLELDEGREHVLVVVPVLVLEQDGLDVLLGQRAGRVQVAKVRVGIRRPQRLELVDPRGRRRVGLGNVPSTSLHRDFV